jgi:hypothetical protein
LKKLVKSDVEIQIIYDNLSRKIDKKLGSSDGVGSDIENFERIDDSIKVDASFN